MKHDEDAVEALRRVEESSGKLSETLNAQPEFTPSNLWLWEAFMSISRKRARGMGAQPIQDRQILDYCELHELVGEDRQLLAYCVVTMDEAFMTWADAKSEAG